MVNVYQTGRSWQTSGLAARCPFPLGNVAFAVVDRLFYDLFLVCNFPGLVDMELVAFCPSIRYKCAYFSLSSSMLSPGLHATSRGARIA